MSEMSREEAIENLKKYDISFFPSYKTIMAMSCEKAISDIEKLQKIEEILNINCEKCGCKDEEDECNDCHRTWIKDIKNILRGE